MKKLVSFLFALALIAGVALALYGLAISTPQVEGGGYGAGQPQPSFTLNPPVSFIDTRPLPPVTTDYDYGYWFAEVGHQPAEPGQCYYFDEITSDWRFPLNVVSIQGTVTFTAGGQTGRMATGNGAHCSDAALVVPIGAGVTTGFNLSIPPLYLPTTPYATYNGGDSISFGVTGGTRSDVIIMISSYTTDGPPIWRDGQTPPTTQGTTAAPTNTPIPPTATNSPVPPTNTPVPPTPLAEGCQLFGPNKVIVCVTNAP